MDARLSIEPVLSLLAELARDLQAEFCPFLDRIAKGLAGLLEAGGEKDPEVIEQVFRFWSLLVMHLQKFLTQDVVGVLKITACLRHYPKDYVQEFMAEAVSLLLRKAPDKQLRKGVRRVLAEVRKGPSLARKTAASALLWHAVRGTASSLHSRAKNVLQVTMGEAEGVCDGVCADDAMVEVVIGALRRACEELPHRELHGVLNWLLDELCGLISSGDSSKLRRRLSLLVSLVRFGHGSVISNYEPLFHLVRLLLEKLVLDSSRGMGGSWHDYSERLLELMLSLVSVQEVSKDPIQISKISQEWSLLLSLKSSAVFLLNFVNGIVVKATPILYGFRGLVISAMGSLIREYPESVVYSMVKFFDRLRDQSDPSYLLDLDTPKNKVLDICNFFHEYLKDWIDKFNCIASHTAQLDHFFSESELSLLWGILWTYPSISGLDAGLSFIVRLVEVIEPLCEKNFEHISGAEKVVLRTLIGAALSSYHKLLLYKNCELHVSVGYFLSCAKRYKSSMRVLYAVADFLDSAFGRRAALEETNTAVSCPELMPSEFADAVQHFSENLSSPSKEIRISTLRILCHYKSADTQSLSSDGHVISGRSQPHNRISEHSNAARILYSIEVSPITVSSGKFAVAFSRMQASLSQGSISETHIILLFNGLIGILHNRFRNLWEPAIETLSKLVVDHCKLLWDNFVQYLGRYQTACFASCQAKIINEESSSNLVECFKSFGGRDFESTPCSSVLSLMLKTLQKMPFVVESRSQHLIQLFLKFLGESDEDSMSNSCMQFVDSKRGLGSSKEWRKILKEWLEVWTLMQAPKSLYQSQKLKGVFVNRLLDDFDPDVQLKVLDCLLRWEDDFLLPYKNNLKNLIDPQQLREEMTTWNLSKESCHIHVLHRDQLVPIVVRILAAKVRNSRMLGSRKHASVRHRRAILCYLAQLDLDELPLFFLLILKSTLSNGNFDEINWKSVDEFQDSNFLAMLTEVNIDELSWKKQSGFLHVLEDVVGSFDQSKMEPFLNVLMAFVVWILKCCMLDYKKSESLSSVEPLHGSKPPERPKNAIKDVRSLCLKVISLVLNKYEAFQFWPCFWDTFFCSVEPLIASFKEEGPSSEKPSSLLSCFIAISRSPDPELISWLDREHNIISSIFSILTVETASDALINSIFEFISNLFALDRLHASHIEPLICSLHHCFSGHKKVNRKSTILPRKVELRIIELLLPHINKSSDAQCLVDIMLPYIKTRGLNEEECLEGLSIMNRLIPILDMDTHGKVLAAICPLLIYSGLNVRLSICGILNELSAKDGSISVLAGLLQKLNAVSSGGMDELEFDTRLEAYKEVTPIFFSKSHESSALLILSHCVYDMSSSEFTLRKCASDALLSFIKFSSSILEHEDENDLDVHQAMEIEGAIKWTKSGVLRVINSLFLQHMGKAMTKENYVRQEWICLLKHMVLTLPPTTAFSSLRALCSSDAETDFFNNILHIQKHRRAKALARFRKVISIEEPSEKILVRVFVPLFFNMLYEVEAGKGEHVRDACVESLASIAGIMKWEHYNSFVMKCFHEMKLRPNMQKVLMRLICSILDKFHFCRTPIQSDDTLHDLIDRSDASSSTDVVEKVLQKSLVPKIQKLLTANDTEINISVSIAAAKLLKWLPSEAMETQLPIILHRVTNFLKNRADSVRDEARSALAALLKELGSTSLGPILHALQGSLKRGYELHILGYTVHFLLSKNLDVLSTTTDDYYDKKLDDNCLQQLLSIIGNDILGNISEEKEVGKIASKMKETRKNMSFYSLTLIAQCISFKEQASKLIQPMKPYLEKHLTHKVKSKLQAMLTHLALGIKQCDFLSPEKSIDLFVFVEDCFSYEVAEGNTQNYHLVTVFALGLLSDRLKKNMDKSDERLMSVLDRLVQQVGRCISSKFEDVVAAAIRCLPPLVRMSLPSLQLEANKIKSLLLDLAHKLGNFNSPLTLSCFKVLSLLLRSNKVTLSDDQLLMLIQFPVFVDLENSPSLEALSLLKEVVRRKLIVPEIYDLVKRIAELMVTSQLEPVRRECSQIFLRFLLDYHLSEKRLQQHLDFLLTNLRYVHPAGREAILEMIHTILEKFPKDVVKEHFDSFYFKLVEGLINENDSKIRSMIGVVIKQLTKCAGRHAFALDISLRWYTVENRKMWSVGAQVLSLMSELMVENKFGALEKWFSDHCTELLTVARVVLTNALAVIEKKEFQFSDQFSIPFWRESYYTLILVEKLLVQFSVLYFQGNVEEVWTSVCKYLLHPHSWLQNVSSRLVASYFGQMQKVRLENLESISSANLLLMKPSKLFSIAVSICLQLKASSVEETTMGLFIQNLAFAMCELHSLSCQMSVSKLWSTLAQDDQEILLKDFRALGLRNKLKMLLLSVTGDQTGDVSRSLFVATLLKKLEKLAFQLEDTRMKAIFSCIQIFSSHVGPSASHEYAVELLQPLYKACEGYAGKVISDDAKHFAEETRNTIQSVMGTESFLQTYNLIRKNLNAKRDRKRENMKRLPVVNPILHAKRKLRLAEKHRAHKRRKMMKFKNGRF